jgi:hypothetical protein
MNRNLFCRLLAASLMAVAVASCRRDDVRVATLRVPQVRNAACEERVRTALQGLRRFDAAYRKPDTLTFDLRTGTLVVSYDSMVVGLKNIEHAILAVGFDVNDLVADPAARAALPPACLAPVVP